MRKRCPGEDSDIVCLNNDNEFLHGDETHHTYDEEAMDIDVTNESSVDDDTNTYQESYTGNETE